VLASITVNYADGTRKKKHATTIEDDTFTGQRHGAGWCISVQVLTGAGSARDVKGGTVVNGVLA